MTPNNARLLTLLRAFSYGVHPRDVDDLEKSDQDAIPQYLEARPSVIEVAYPQRSYHEGLHALRFASVEAAWEYALSEGLIPAPKHFTWTFHDDYLGDTFRPRNFGQLFRFAYYGPERIRTAEVLVQELLGLIQKAYLVKNPPVTAVVWEAHRYRRDPSEKYHPGPYHSATPSPHLQPYADSINELSERLWGLGLEMVWDPQLNHSREQGRAYHSPRRPRIYYGLPPSTSVGAVHEPCFR